MCRRIFLTPLCKRKNTFYKYNIFIHVCWICIRNLFKDTPKKIAAVTIEEKEEIEHLDFSPFFFIWFEFLSRQCCVWDQERHSGHYRYSWCTQSPTTLLLKPLQHQQLCIRNILYFQDLSFPRSKPWAKDLGASALLRKCLQENLARQ